MKMTVSGGVNRAIEPILTGRTPPRFSLVNTSTLSMAEPARYTPDPILALCSHVAVVRKCNQSPPSAGAAGGREGAKTEGAMISIAVNISTVLFR